jgi:nucleotide-binding universal stress UspA family protein
MRTYLVVMDGSAEAPAALRFAAMRAARTGGAVEVIAIVEPAEFSIIGAVQAAMEEESRLRVEAMVAQATGAIEETAGIKPAISLRQGDPVKAVNEMLAERTDIAILVLAAGEKGPGPLIGHFAGAGASGLPCPLVIVPAGLSDEALDRLT